MYFCSPGTFYKFVYLHKWQKTAIVIMPSEIAYYYAIHNLKTIQILLWRLKTKLTRRSQAFLGMSFRSARRSSCSFSKSSLPIGPAEAWLIGLSLKELTKQENKQWKKYQIYTVLRFRRHSFGILKRIKGKRKWRNKNPVVCWRCVYLSLCVWEIEKL